MRVKRSRKAVVAASIAVVLVGGAAFAYWALSGSGTGSVQTKTDAQALVVKSNTPGPIAPGQQITLSGTITNPNSTSVKLGVLSAALANTEGIDAKELTLGGNSDSDAKLIPGRTTLNWSGLTLKYMDSETVNQNAGRGVQIDLTFTLSQYIEPAGGYNAIPGNLPANTWSQAFQATKTTEFGDEVGLSGGRTLTSMSVVLNSKACGTSGSWQGECVTAPGATSVVPLTFTIYGVNSDGTRGTQLSTLTKDVPVRYRPSASPSCTAGKWLDTTDNTCNSGIHQVVTMGMTAAQTLPEKVIWTIKYNTSSYGSPARGTDTECFKSSTGCIYDSLNVGVFSFPGAPFAGTDIDEDRVFVNVGSIDVPTGWKGYRPLGANATK